MKTLSKIKIKDETFEIKDENSRIAIAEEVTRAQNAEKQNATAIQQNATAIANEKTRAEQAEQTINKSLTSVNNNLATLNTTIVNYNSKYGISGAVSKAEVVAKIASGTAVDRGMIVTYYAEDGWHTIQYKLNYYNPTEGAKESNWVEIGGGGESSYSLPVATTDTLGGVKSYPREGECYSDLSGVRYAVVVGSSGLAHVTLPYADSGKDGVVRVNSSVNPRSNNPVSGKAVAEYVDEAIDTPVVNQTATTATIAPNVLNVWGEVAELNITLADGKDNVVNEYMFQFTSGATATTLVLPADIKWVAAPNIQANKTYQVSIINNLGVIGEFGNE